MASAGPPHLEPARLLRANHVSYLRFIDVRTLLDERAAYGRRRLCKAKARAISERSARYQPLGAENRKAPGVFDQGAQTGHRGRGRGGGSALRPEPRHWGPRACKARPHTDSGLSVPTPPEGFPAEMVHFARARHPHMPACHRDDAGACVAVAGKLNNMKVQPFGAAPRPVPAFALMIASSQFPQVEGRRPRSSRR